MSYFKEGNLEEAVECTDVDGDLNDYLDSDSEYEDAIKRFHYLGDSDYNKDF